DVVARAAGAVALGAAALDDEVFDDAVERQAVVEALGREVEEVFRVAGRDVVPQLDDDGAFGGFDAGLGVIRFAHIRSFLRTSGFQKYSESNNVTGLKGNRVGGDF